MGKTVLNPSVQMFGLGCLDKILLSFRSFYNASVQNPCVLGFLYKAMFSSDACHLLLFTQGCVCDVCL